MTGRILENPITGERMRFLVTTEESGGSLFRVEYFMPPRGSLRGTHLHPAQEQRLEVVSGILGCRIAGEVRMLRQGESITIPTGIPHEQWNGGEEILHLREEVRPALRMERFFERMFEMGRDGKLNLRTLPGLIRTAMLFQEFRDEFRVLTPIPARLLFPILAWVGKRAGARIR